MVFALGSVKKLYFLPALKGLLLLLALILAPGISHAQNLYIELGDPEIAINEYFYIAINSEGEPIKEYSKFPDISGFSKAGRSLSTTTTTIAGGGESVNQAMVQRYKPSREGTFRLKPFSIRVNGKSVDSEGILILVGPEAEPEHESDDQDLSLEDENTEPEIPDLSEFKDKNTDVFLNLSASKKSVYTGEGVHITLYFYLAFNERNMLEFHNFGKQLPEIVKKIRQPNVWEEFFEQYEIEPENLEINGKPFLRFKLYEAVYFPLTAQPLLFPSLSLDMLRYRMLTERSFDGPARVAEKKTYYSAPLIVEVKELPPHPLREKVAVGNFRLKEATNKKQFKTREGFEYVFRIEGTGNIPALTAPDISWPDGLSPYNPAIKQFTRRSYGRITGTKEFNYFVTPQEPGNYNFGNFAYWVYFNPASMKYDTLRSNLKINVTGPSSRNLTIASAPPDSYYEAIDNAGNKLLSIENFDRIKIYANMVLTALLIIVLIIYFRK